MGKRKRLANKELDYTSSIFQIKRREDVEEYVFIKSDFHYHLVIQKAQFKNLSIYEAIQEGKRFKRIGEYTKWIGSSFKFWQDEVIRPSSGGRFAELLKKKSKTLIPIEKFLTHQEECIRDFVKLFDNEVDNTKILQALKQENLKNNL